MTCWSNTLEVLISIKNTGIGIPQEKHEQIFKRFRQAQSLYNREREGTGIGLSLVKSIIDSHQGNIYINSQYEEGTEFIIELPININSEENSLAPQNTTFDKDKIEKISIEFSDIYS